MKFCTVRKLISNRRTNKLSHHLGLLYILRLIWAFVHWSYKWKSSLGMIYCTVCNRLEILCIQQIVWLKFQCLKQTHIFFHQQFLIESSRINYQVLSTKLLTFQQIYAIFNDLYYNWKYIVAFPKINSKILTFSQGLNNTRAWLAQLQKNKLSGEPEVSSPFISILKQQLPGTTSKLVKVIYL